MSDLKRRLRDIEGYEPPDLWREIEGREPRALPRVPAGRRVLVVAVAFAVSFAGIGVAVRSFRSSPSSVGEAPVSATVSNGLITFGGGTRIYTMMPDGSGLVVLEDPGAIAYYGPEWSPDGTRIAFYGYPPGGASARYGGGADYDIFVMNPDVSVLTNLTTNPADVKSGFSQMVPSWSPDGSKIAYDGDDGLYVMNADGSDQTRIASGQGASWSPDGTRIVFQGPGGAIWSVAPDGSGLVQLTSGAGSDDFPTYSPDGTSVAYYHPEGSHQVSYVVMSSDGSGQTTVASFQADSWGRPVWSPDGIEIAFDLYRHGTWDIYVVNADGTGLSDLTPTPNRDENTPVWSPDGTRIAFEASDVLARDTDNTGTFDIYVMNPDGTDQTRLTTDVHSMGFDMSWQVVTAAPGNATPSPSGPSPSAGRFPVDRRRSGHPRQGSASPRAPLRSTVGADRLSDRCRYSSRDGPRYTVCGGARRGRGRPSSDRRRGRDELPPFPLAGAGDRDELPPFPLAGAGDRDEDHPGATQKGPCGGSWMVFVPRGGPRMIWDVSAITSPEAVIVTLNRSMPRGAGPS